MLYEAFSPTQSYITLVVRAPSVKRAVEIATEAFAVYANEPLDEITVEELDPLGDEGVLIEDAS